LTGNKACTSSNTETAPRNLDCTPKILLRHACASFSGGQERVEGLQPETLPPLPDRFSIDRPELP
jgi:hypothetical protein